VEAVDAYTLIASTQAAGNAPAITFLLQPVSDQQTVVHGLLQPEVLPTDRVAVLRYHNAQLSRVRDEVESAQPSQSRDEAGAPSRGS